MDKIKINQGRSVPLTFRFVGLLVVIALIVFVMDSLTEELAILVGMGLSFLIPMMWFSFDILTIDPIQKKIHQGIWAMGIKTGRPKSYNQIEKIFVNQVKTSQQMYSQSNQGYASKGVEYSAFLKLDNGEKIFLFSEKEEKAADAKVMKISKKLGLNLKE